MEFFEEWQKENPSEEFFVEDIGTIQEYFVKLYEELNFLEEGIESQILYIQLMKIELEELAFKNNEERTKKCDQWIGKIFINIMLVDEEKYNKKYQLRIEVDEIIEEMWILMRQTSRRRYNI